jgi:uncharacterized membrane protein YkvA (DUF1232 family)
MNRTDNAIAIRPVHAYRRHYCETRFWRSLGRYARKAGREIAETALILYLAAAAPTTPAWARAVMLGALGYFVSLIDAVPDLTPIVGYTDDLAVMTAAIAAVARSVTPAIRAEAARRAQRLFGE